MRATTKTGKIRRRIEIRLEKVSSKLELGLWDEAKELISQLKHLHIELKIAKAEQHARLVRYNKRNGIVD